MANIIGRRIRDDIGSRGTVVDAGQDGREARVAWDDRETTWVAMRDVQIIGRVDAEATS
jgi:hypothetical protein